MAEAFYASRAKVRAVMSRIVEEHYDRLPESPRIRDLAIWFRVCQWNARAYLYVYFVDQIREQCSASKGSPCTVSQARAHLAEFLTKSARTVERRMRHKPFPLVANGNGNGRGGRGN